MVGSAAIKQGRSANRKHTYFFFWPYTTLYYNIISLDKQKNQRKIVNNFLPIIYSICFGCSKYPSH